MARRTKAQAQETRQAILNAAERLFFANGVLQTSLEQIAQEAQVTRGAVYWHFANKAELFRALHESVRLPQEDLIESAVAEGHPDPLALLERVALECLELISTDERRWRVYTILLVRFEAVGEMIEAVQRQREAHVRMHNNLVRVFELAAESRALQSRWAPETAAWTFGSMMGGLITNWLRQDRSFDVVAIGSACIRELFVSFRSQTAPTANAFST